MGRLDREDRSGTALVLLLGVGLAALWIVLVAIYRQPARKDLVTPGFDVKQVQAAASESAAAPAPRPEEPSGLSLVTNAAPAGSALVAAPAAAPPAAPPAARAAVASAASGDPAARFRAEFRESFAKVRDLSYEYKRKFPSVAKWARDWHDSPELHKLNEDYKRDQDVVAFLRGCARSRDFSKMVASYAGDPGIMATLGGMVGRLPQVVGAGMSYAMNDSLLKPFAEKTLSDAALPPALAAAASASGALAAPPAASR